MEGQKNGFLVVQRWDVSTIEKLSGKRYVTEASKWTPPAGSLSDEDILSKYKGIEGIQWPLEERQKYQALRIIGGLAHPDDYHLCKQYYLEACILPHVIAFLYCEKEEYLEKDIPASVQNRFYFAGYDYGYVDEYNIFSSIYHEVLPGRYVYHRHYEEMNAFSARLNEHLLFRNLADAEDLGRVRAELLAQGANLETIEEGDRIYPIKVYVYSESQK